MVIKDVFHIKKRGVIVVGNTTEGTLKNRDRVRITGQDMPEIITILGSVVLAHPDPIPADFDFSSDQPGGLYSRSIFP